MQTTLWFREGFWAEARDEQALLEVRGALEPASCPLPGC